MFLRVSASTSFDTMILNEWLLFWSPCWLLAGRRWNASQSENFDNVSRCVYLSRRESADNNERDRMFPTRDSDLTKTCSRSVFVPMILWRLLEIFYPTISAVTHYVLIKRIILRTRDLSMIIELRAIKLNILRSFVSFFLQRKIIRESIESGGFLWIREKFF